MKYKDRDELVASLREYADFLEAHGHKLPIRYPHLTHRTFVYDKYDKEGNKIPDSGRVRMGNVARVLAPCEKVWTDHYLDVKRKFGEHLTVEFTAARELVCEKKVVGTREVEEKIYPAHTEEIIEWECNDPSLLR